MVRRDSVCWTLGRALCLLAALGAAGCGGAGVGAREEGRVIVTEPDKVTKASAPASAAGSQPANPSEPGSAAP